MKQTGENSAIAEIVATKAKDRGSICKQKCKRYGWAKGMIPVVAMLIFFLAGLLTACSGSNAEKPTPASSFEYSAKGSKVTITKFIGEETAVIIPQKLDGGEVTAIGEGAFEGLDNLASLKLPSGLVSIGKNAFNSCSKLREIKLPDSLTSVGEKAFSDCRILESVTIGKGLAEVGDNAFANCSAIKNIYISDIQEWCKIDFSNMFSNPLYIAQNLYIKGTNTVGISIPQGVQGIGNFAFAGFRGLETVELPDSLKTIGFGAFRSCVNLTDIKLGSGLISLGNYAFYGCEGLTKIALPAGLSAIPEGAFTACASLAEINLPINLLSIQKYAFYNCDVLKKVDIPEGVAEIGEGAFYGAKGLESIVIPKSTTKINDWAFRACSALKKIYFAGTEADWENVEIGFLNDPLREAARYYHSLTQPEHEGNFWHYDQGVPTEWQPLQPII